MSDQIKNKLVIRMSGEHAVVDFLLTLIIVIVAAKIAGFIAERLKQPAVLGELLIGIVLGPSLLGWVHIDDVILIFLAEVGVILLLFDVGLKSSIDELVHAGKTSAIVAIIGVVAPLGMGYAFSNMVLGLDPIASFFVGATLTATSVGVTMRVLNDIGKVKSEEGKVILGAAVIDDIIGLILLSIIVDIVASGGLSLMNIGKISFISIAFLALSIVIGIKLTPQFIKLIGYLKVKRTFIIGAFVFAIAMAYLAAGIGLATIVGAFAAGLVLEKTQEKLHFQKRVKPVADLFVPIFFVMAGAVVDLSSIASVEIIISGLVLTVIAIIGKLISGAGCIGSPAKGLPVGVGMVPRGEVGLIFAAFGLTNKLIDSSLYSILIIVIILTTLITPPALLKLMGGEPEYTVKSEEEEEPKEEEPKPPTTTLLE
jgi:Kef-type K+ transport system membrane component KefB